MSIVFDIFLTVLFIIPLAVLLLVHIGVGGCFHFNSSNVILAGTAFCALMNNAPHSGSDMVLMTAFITFANTYIGPLKSVPSQLPK